MREGFNGSSSYDNAADSRDPESIRLCDSPGCELAGEHRAPKSRERLRDYYWFCLEHVRDYNQAWNYYAGMTDAEVDGQRHADTFWHRPTWPFSGEGRFDEGLNDGFGLFDEDESAGEEQKKRFEASAPELAALAVLNLSPPVTRQEVKSRYKELVKQHHPDANGGSKKAEERLKAINRAYETLNRVPPTQARTT